MAASELVESALQQLTGEMEQLRTEDADLSSPPQPQPQPLSTAASTTHSRPATSSAVRPMTAAAATALASTLPVDPLFPSAPSVQLLQALSDAAASGPTAAALPPPAAAEQSNSTALSSSSFLASSSFPTSLSHSNRQRGLLDGVGPSLGQAPTFAGFSAFAAVPSALRSLEVRVQQKLQWMSDTATPQLSTFHIAAHIHRRRYLS